MTFADIPRNPSPRMLRQFSAIWLVFFGGSGLWQYLGRDRPTVGLVMMVLAVVIGVLGLVRPTAVRGVFVGYMILAFPIGWTVSNIALGLLFYCLFTPLGLVLRLTRRDAMMRRKPSGDSYWLEKRYSDDAPSYLRQY